LALNDIVVEHRLSSCLTWGCFNNNFVQRMKIVS